MSQIILVSPSRLVTDPARNPRFAGTTDPAAAARKFYASDAYAALCESFRASGITIPISVMKRKQGSGYIVLEGFSRAHWAKAEMKKNKAIRVPVNVLKKAKDARTAAVAMNTARVAYDPIARAGSFAALVDEWGSVEQAATRAGVKASTVRETLRLLRLPLRAQKMIQSGKLSVGNASKIMRLPGWKEFQQKKAGKVTPKVAKIASEFKTRVMEMLDTIAGMEHVPDVGSAWNKGRKPKKNAESSDDVAIVLPTIESLRDACFLYGRKLARVYLSGTNDRMKITRYRTAMEHLAASMGWCVPEALEDVLQSTDGRRLYPAKTNTVLRREVVNEYTLSGVIEIARREDRRFAENDELLDDSNWMNFFRQDVPLETLVQRLNRRLK